MKDLKDDIISGIMISQIIYKATEENPDFDFSTLTGDQSNNNLLWKDGLYEAEAHYSSWNALRPVFEDGQLLVDDSLLEIRERLAK
mgnify:CR=1 FL=1